MKNTDIVSGSSMKKLWWKMEDSLSVFWKTLNPKMNEAYNILKKNYIYDVNLTRHENVMRNLFEIGDGDVYVGVLDEKIFNNKEKAIYVSTDGFKFLIVFYTKKSPSRYGDNNPETYVQPGIRVFRVFEPLDTNCIENAWGVKTTEQWATKLDLCAETFTDVTKHSQIIDNYPVCNRPTIDRVIFDINNQKFQHYSPIFDSCEGNYSREFSAIECMFFNMCLICESLKIKNVTFL